MADWTPSLKYERDSAQEWLNHRAGLAAHVRKVVYFISRFGASRAAIALAKRPFSVWWVCAQIKAGIAVWKADNTFTQAVCLVRCNLTVFDKI